MSLNLNFPRRNFEYYNASNAQIINITKGKLVAVWLSPLRSIRPKKTGGTWKFNAFTNFKSPPDGSHAEMHHCYSNGHWQKYAIERKHGIGLPLECMPGD